MAKLDEEVRKVLEDFVEANDEPCRPDHHGYCQAHFLHVMQYCPVPRAKKLLENHYMYEQGVCTTRHKWK